jgi:hypothetical protein
MLAEIVGGQWRPGIGDPTLMGWLTVVAYLSASWACGWATRAEEKLAGDHARARSVFWWLLAGLLLLLGINKQLDLQTALTVVGRRLAREQGWYENRRFYQVIFLGCIAVVGWFLLGLLCWLSRPLRGRRLLALLGGVYLGSFVVIRASSFHHVDQLLGLRFGGLKWNWILELMGIACVGVSAVWTTRVAQGHSL